MIDRTLAVLMILLLTPIFAMVGVIVFVTSGRPILFKQLRSGLNGTPFEIVKFRTMRPASKSERTDADRLTLFGRFLRSSSLDELPSLWNIARGDMRFVGPRPLIAHYIDQYGPVERRRLSVKPGLTGWAQVMGRNRLTWQERFELDAWYVDHRSLKLDMKIILKTIPALLAVRSVRHPGHETMPPFVTNLEVDHTESDLRTKRGNQDL